MSFLEWSCEDVAEWIQSLGYPQYTFMWNMDKGPTAVSALSGSSSRTRLTIYIGIGNFIIVSRTHPYLRISHAVSVTTAPVRLECFTENFITGKKLIYVNCCYLPQLGITDFEHMKVISAHVRELLAFTEPPWSQSIADPPRDNMGMFLELKSRTGKKADALTYTQFLESQNK